MRWRPLPRAHALAATYEGTCAGGHLRGAQVKGAQDRRGGRGDVPGAGACCGGQRGAVAGCRAARLTADARRLSVRQIRELGGVDQKRQAAGRDDRRAEDPPDLPGASLPDLPGEDPHPGAVPPRLSRPADAATSSRRMAPAASTVPARAARWRSVGESEGRGPPLSAQDIQKMLEERGVTSKWARDIGIGSKFEE